MVNKKEKTGKEIISLYKEMKKAGITPEEVMLFLLGHMEQIKASKIGMDLKNEKGAPFCITVSVNQGVIDDQEDNFIPQKVKPTTPSVV